MTRSDEETPDRRRWTVGRMAATLVLVSSFGFWIWAFSPWAPRDNPDRLDDRAFVDAAEQRCVAADDLIAAMPSAREAESAIDRADQVEAGTRHVEAMVADLRDLASMVDSVAERDILFKWFIDWDQYIDDRWAHVERLRTADENTSDRDLAFVLSAVVGGGIYTQRLDGFARVNDMDACLIPGDV